MDPLRVFIGFDHRESQAYHVLVHSLVRHSSIPLAIIPLVQSQLRMTKKYWRERSDLESTDFSLTRFLVPHLSNFQDISIFMDCDMLCRADIMQLLAYPLAYPDKAVFVAKHDYVPQTGRKFFNQVQTPYARKNWSSLMVFNNHLCKPLTLNYVNHTQGLALHQFQWLEDAQIGELPLGWNWLVGEYPPNEEAKMLHYTLGTPCIEEYKNCEQADLWHDEAGMIPLIPMRV